MEYNRTYWQAREGTKLNKFQKVNETTSTVELVNAPDSVTIEGTEVTTARLNNMESGIAGAVAGMNEIQGVIDFTNMIDFSSGLGQLPRGWFGMTTLGNDVYVSVAGGDIYKQTNGTGNFVALGQTSRSWYGMTTLGNDVYACVYGGDIYKQTNGVGDFIALGQASRQWQGMTTLGSDIYACVQFGDIYKQTNGVGDFVALGQTSRGWNGMTTLGNDVYACVLNGDIYKQTGGIGNFFALGQETKGWRGMTALGNDVYACVSNGDIYKQTNGTGDFIALGQASRNWYGMTTLDSVLYACVYNGDIYTAPHLTGNTFRASSSFTLPAIPDGARKRILNTHATNAITVTAYTGTTIEGQATMTLSAGHEVEIELIGTVWKKTGWNEKSLLTYSAPVDCSSRVAEYTGDGGGATIKDRAGNGNNLTATDITYVNGKYGKEMSFNGSTSFAKASSPVIGTTGTVAVRFKANTFVSAGRLFDNSNGVTGISFRQSTSTNIQFYIYDSTAPMLVANMTIIPTEYNSIVVCFSGLSFAVYVNGTKQGDYTSARQFVAGLNNLFVGRYVQSAVEFFSGIISHFRYDSRIWTADEARAWSLNPISIDSRV